MKKVWSKQFCDEMNVSAAFVYRCKSSKNLSLRMAASNVYQVFCDGNLLAYGPMRCAKGYSNIRTYPLPNTGSRDLNLTVIVAGYQINTFCIVDEKPFFAAEVLDGEIVVADTYAFAMYHLNDRLTKVQRYSYQRPFVESYRLDGRREQLFEGTFEYPILDMVEVEGNILLDCDLSEPKFENRTPRIIEYGSAERDENREVWYDRSLKKIDEEYKVYPLEELDEVLTEEMCRIACRMDTINKPDPFIEKGYQLFDFGENTAGFFVLDVTVPAHAEVYVLFDEILTDEWKTKKDFSGPERPLVPYRLDCCNAVKWSLSEGEHHLVSFEPYVFRYAKIVVLTGGANIDAFSALTYENPDRNLSFSCGDARLQSIFEAASNTFVQNAVDVLTDCPSRERAGWLCDSFFSSRAEKLITGKNKVEKNFLNAILLAPALPGAEGMIPMCYPSDFLERGYIPNWAMWYVIELFDFRRRTGDVEFVNACKGKVYDLIRFFDRFVDKYGFLDKLENWVFIEWSRANEFTQDVNYPTNMLFYAMLHCASLLYGDESLAERAENLKKNIIEHSYNGEFFADNGVWKDGELVRTTNTSETCQYYAFYMNVATKETFPKLYDVMIGEFGPNRDVEKTYPNVFPSNAFIGNFLRLDYLRRVELGDQAVAECRDYFGYMADRTGTLWEMDQPTASCDHGFASYVLNLIVGASTGLVDFDTNAKTVTVAKPSLKVKSKLTLWLADGAIKIKARNGRMRIKLPKGYLLVKE